MKNKVVEDYVDEDGCLHCGICRKRKQMKVSLMGFEHVVSCLCECEVKARQELNEKMQWEEAQRQLYQRKSVGLRERRFWEWKFENDNGSNQKILIARQYVENWTDMKRKNVGLLLMGPVGTGKSFFAGCIANALLEQGERVMMTNFSRILNEMTSYQADKNQIIQNLVDYPLLIIDDLGIERNSEFALEQVYNVIDRRTFGIYQIKDDSPGENYAFMNMRFIESHGMQIKKEDYKLVYVGELSGNMSLDDIFERFNIDRPEDFRGHSLSVSDIIVLNDGEKVTAHFVDSISFEQLDSFLNLEEQVLSELAYEVGERYFAIQRTEEGYDYSFYDEDFRLMDGGVYENDQISIEEAAEELLEDEGWTGERIRGDYDQLMEKVEEMDEVVMAEIQKSQGEYKPLAKVEELEEANYNMIDNVLNNMPPKKEPYLEYFATECDEFHDMGAYEKSTDVNQIAAVYEKYRENPKTAYLGCSMGIIYCDPEDSYYDEAEFAIVKGNTVFGDLMDDVRFYGELALVREGIEKIHEALPDYKYVPMRDVREAMYPEKMTTEQLAEALDEIAEAFDPYEYRDNVERGENTVQEVMLDLRSGNIHSYISYLKDIVDEECDLSVRAGVLIERLKAYEPELPKDMEPMVYVNYCEESDLMNPRCQKLSELDAKTAEMDKEWYAKRDPKTEEPTKIAKIYVTVYYAEKGEQMLHHFKKSMDIGNGHGGIVSQLKYDNEMKLTDEYWINYQKGKGSEEFQKYMEDLTDMQNHVLPYLQSFCNLEEKGVKERREQQIAERYEGRADERVTSTEANEVVKDVGKTDRKPAQQKQAVDGKDKKLSIHERLEINKRIIQEKQGKDKTERGVDLGVRTV